MPVIQLEKPAEAKEMLSIKQEENKLVVKINFSSLDLINTCLKKAYYTLHKGLVANEEAQALSFGKAIHKAMETWYILDLELREYECPKYKQSLEQLAYGHGLGEEYRDARLASIAAFVKEAMPGLRHLEDTDKRSIASGVKLLDAYFKTYRDDGYQVLCDEYGPIVERTVEHVMYDSRALRIIYFGTVDLGLENKQLGVKCIADHKTTSALGQQFFNRIKPNHQYTGYIWLAQKALGLDINQFMVNGLQVAKTKQEFARQLTTRDADDMDDFIDCVIEAVYRYCTAKELERWPCVASYPCSQWSGCQFMEVCSAPANLKETILANRWSVKNDSSN